MKILVISFAGIGDSLLATPLIRALRQQYPSATIDVFVMWAGARDLLEGNPRINTIHQQNFFKESTLANLRFLWRLRKMRYDVSINTYPQSKIHYRIIAKIINAPKRLSHRHENHWFLDDWLANFSNEQDYGIHCVENNLNLLKLLGGADQENAPPLPVPLLHRMEEKGRGTGSLSDLRTLEPEIFFSAAEEQWADSFSREKLLEGRTLLAVHVGSGRTKNLILKRWPVDHYVRFIQMLVTAHPNLTVLLFGGPEEKEDNESILRAAQHPRVMAVPSKTMKQAAALLKRCNVFLSVDNAFMHLAAAVKVPQQIVIESPTFNKTIEPYHRPFRLVKNPMVAGRNLDYYRYDGRDIQGTREHLLAVMRSISPEAVLKEVERTLESSSSS